MCDDSYGRGCYDKRCEAAWARVLVCLFVLAAVELCWTCDMTSEGWV